MNCRAVQKRLVAYHDGELSPSESARVREHLSTCLVCRRESQDLHRLQLRPTLVVPPRVQARLVQRVDAILQTPPRPRRRLWLLGKTRVSRGLALAYTLILAITATWGLHNWLEARTLQVALEQHADPVRPDASSIKADEFRPASWEPEDAEGDDLL